MEYNFYFYEEYMKLREEEFKRKLNDFKYYNSEKNSNKKWYGFINKNKCA